MDMYHVNGVLMIVWISSLAGMVAVGNKRSVVLFFTVTAILAVLEQYS